MLLLKVAGFVYEGQGVIFVVHGFVKITTKRITNQMIDFFVVKSILLK